MLKPKFRTMRLHLLVPRVEGAPMTTTKTFNCSVRQKGQRQQRSGARKNGDIGR